MRAWSQWSLKLGCQKYNLSHLSNLRPCQPVCAGSNQASRREAPRSTNVALAALPNTWLRCSSAHFPGRGAHLYIHSVFARMGVLYMHMHSLSTHIATLLMGEVMMSCVPQGKVKRSAESECGLRIGKSVMLVLQIA